MGRETSREIEDEIANRGILTTSIILLVAYVVSAWFVNQIATFQIHSSHYIPKIYYQLLV